ncbi:hypothetical protein JCM14244_04740 [Venenivibrio stagnispumantis]|uniref:Uncharacterized protein n=1 Tax=Venenivibrio stagnispumantis TaxID=407998 RepID=A0AA45WP26_9AQUI|nr:hypothetical protein SAMN06264868_12022 [Venenivibrio stagnispumantis]
MDKNMIMNILYFIVILIAVYTAFKIVGFVMRIISIGIIIVISYFIWKYFLNN